MLFDIKPAKASYRDAGDAVFVEFDQDVQPDEVDSYLGDLPAEVSPEKTGNRVRLQPADAFFTFLGERKRKGVMKRLEGIFGARRST